MKTVNIFGEKHLKQHTRTREACRGVMISDDRILLTYEVNTDQWFLPGGGMETGESAEQCCARELAEETGYVVETDVHYLTINEYYDDWLFASHYFVCRCVGETQSKRTEREIEEGLEPRWISLKEAVGIFARHREYADENPMKSGAYFREYTALQHYLELQ